MSGKKKFETYLSRRIIGPKDGPLFFCRLCGKYQPENQFYKKKGGKWGLDSKCKIHYTRSAENDDPEMAYLRLDPIKESDFQHVQELLVCLGYTFTGQTTIHEQFKNKHNLN